MPISEEKENPNHITKSEIFCEYLEDKFPAKYSKLGIAYFRCPMYSKESQEDIVCLELRTENCPIKDRLEKMIEKL